MNAFEANMVSNFINEHWGLFNNFLEEHGYDEEFAENILESLHSVVCEQ